MQITPASPASPEWKISSAPVGYQIAQDAMEARVAAIRGQGAPELIWLLEHPPLYTAGTSANAADLLQPDRFAVYKTGRGGRYTYHGPGQRVGYVMLDLKRRTPDLRCFVHQLEDWIIRTIAVFDVTGLRRKGRVGIWVDRGGGREEKIAAIGVRVRRWVTFHGIALNVNPDLSHFTGIVPCGIAEYGVTSLQALGVEASLQQVDAALRKTFADVF